MKKLLSAFAALGLAVTSTSVVVSCNDPKTEDKAIDLNKLETTLAVQSAKSANSFKEAIIKKLNEKEEFKKLSLDSVQIKIKTDRDDFKEVNDHNLGDYGTKKIKISPKENEKGVTGDIEITVTWNPVESNSGSEAQNDSNASSDQGESPAPVPSVEISAEELKITSKRNVNDFKRVLINSLKQSKAILLEILGIKSGEGTEEDKKTEDEINNNFDSFIKQLVKNPGLLEILTPDGHKLADKDLKSKFQIKLRFQGKDDSTDAINVKWTEKKLRI